MHPLIASDLLSHIPRMLKITRIIANQEKRFDGSGNRQDFCSGKEIPLGARILKVVSDFKYSPRARGTSGESEALHSKASRLIMILMSCWGYEAVIGVKAGYEEKAVKVRIGGRNALTEDVRVRDGRLLVAKGYHVNRTLRERLRNFAEQGVINEPIRVLVPIG